jgi:hypothetical protein
MNIQLLKDLSLEERLELLNKDYADKVVTDVLDLFSEDMIEYYDNICTAFLGATEQKRAGEDDSLTWCEGCQQLEGSTCEISRVPFLDIAYNWNKKIWIKDSDDIGSTL